MKTSYKCKSCAQFFSHPVSKEGIFVCPSCETPDFETVLCKKLMNDCP